jgi:KaiC/GvpD/RAD55 family RecA-like ATPase
LSSLCYAVYTRKILKRGGEGDVKEFAEVAARGMTLIYGPPECGKTSVAMRLASRLEGRVMWVSTAEGPDLLAQVARRLGVDSSKV